MFALLFGVGFYIFLERLQKKGLGLKAADLYARRMLWLFVIGIAHAYLIWDGDILYHYAICGLLLLPFRSIKSPYLVLVIALLCTLLLVRSCEQSQRRLGWQQANDTALKIPEDQRTEADTKAISFWNEVTSPQMPDISLQQIPKSTYWIGLKESYKHISAHKGMLYYQGLLFSTLILMIVGIIFYRSGIFSDYRLWKHYWLISFAVLALALGINYLRYYHWTYLEHKPILSVYKAWLFTFPRELLGIGYVLLPNGLYQKYCKSFRFKLISNVGRTALSNYIFQNVLLGFVFYGYGLAYFNRLSRFDLLGIVFIIWILQLVLSSFWLRKFQQGPLEWVWRKLTYGNFDRSN
ncbi:DUF418 domain-containing protein [Croceimicrobium sp.]|uniref:DUF418 domain-containing protein n=1 Tax=Croceimicrobium sp. TaxID=2828340 RepID=UPI003BAD7C27